LHNAASNPRIWIRGGLTRAPQLKRRALGRQSNRSANTMIQRLSRVLSLIALIFGVAPSQADAQWLESKAAHYTVFYQAGFERDVEFTRKWLDATEQLMKSKYASSPDRYFISIL
jgi:hypothetical protein